MKKILDWLLSAIYLLYFGLLLVVFHVAQVIAYNLFGRAAQQRVVAWLNAGIVYGWLITGSSARVQYLAEIPENQPLILVANHQSMFDIPGIIWFLRHYKPVFVSKIELAKGIPSISYNLRMSGAALIDRKDSKQAIKEIIRVGRFALDNNFSIAIFPEGTRSRTGQVKPFAVGGTATLLKVMKNPVVVPIAIKNTGLFNPTGLFPLRSFTPMTWTTLQPISTEGKAAEEVVAEAEQAIKEFLSKS